MCLAYTAPLLFLNKLHVSNFGLSSNGTSVAQKKPEAIWSELLKSNPQSLQHGSRLKIRLDIHHHSPYSMIKHDQAMFIEFLFVSSMLSMPTLKMQRISKKNPSCLKDPMPSYSNAWGTMDSYRPRTVPVR